MEICELSEVNSLAISKALAINCSWGKTSETNNS
jgi:hypothetical protein